MNFSIGTVGASSYLRRVTEPEAVLYFQFDTLVNLELTLSCGCHYRVSEFMIGKMPLRFHGFDCGQRIFCHDCEFPGWQFIELVTFL